MRKDYGIYNNHELDNTLLILFSDEEVTNSKKKDEIEVLYHDIKIIGYKISNFIRYAKIKYSGIIFLPSNTLVDVINSVLKNHQLETLEYKTSSGYITKRNGNNLGVFALKGTFLRDQSISKGKFVTYFDLYIKNENSDELITIDESIKEGVDFFQMEVK